MRFTVIDNKHNILYYYYMKIIKKFLILFFIDNPYLYYITKCHQIPERSFFINNRQFNICARCTGIITGFFFGIILTPVFFF